MDWDFDEKTKKKNRWYEQCVFKRWAIGKKKASKKKKKQEEIKVKNCIYIIEIIKELPS